MSLIEQIEKLPRYDFNCGETVPSPLVGDYIKFSDLRAIIEQHKSEAVNPVCTMLAKDGFVWSTVWRVPFEDGKHLLYTAPQPDHTKLIGELATALHWAIENIDQRLLSNDMAKYEAMLKAKRTRDLAREAIK